MSTNENLIAIDAPNWRLGFKNILRSDIPGWFRTMKWWSLFFLVLFMTNIIILFTLFGGQAENAIRLFSVFQGLYPCFGVIMVMQGTLLGGKNNGTTAWVLSKPVSRTGFILAKFVNIALAGTLFLIIFPGAIAFLEFALFPEINFSISGFILGNCVLWLNMIFYLSLSLVAGTFFKSKGSIIIVLVNFIALQKLLDGAFSSKLVVLTLTFPIPFISIVESLMMGQPLFSLWPIFLEIFACLIFVPLAIYRFNKEEF